jgi:mRNA interferase MazF
VRRGEIWWASLPEPAGSAPGFRRPVVIVQTNEFKASRIATMIAVVVTSNLRLAEAPGNVLLRARATGLKRDSVANVSQLVTIDKNFLTEKAGRVAPAQMQQIEAGLELVLGL